MQHMSRTTNTLKEYRRKIRKSNRAIRERDTKVFPFDRAEEFTRRSKLRFYPEQAAVSCSFILYASFSRKAKTTMTMRSLTFRL
jgi:hypothetical protein